MWKSPRRRGICVLGRVLGDQSASCARKNLTRFLPEFPSTTPLLVKRKSPSLPARTQQARAESGVRLNFAQAATNLFSALSPPRLRLPAPPPALSWAAAPVRHIVGHAQLDNSQADLLAHLLEERLAQRDRRPAHRNHHAADAHRLGLDEGLADRLLGRKLRRAL